MREYQVEFEDKAVLTFSAATQLDALAIIVDHAYPEQEFTLKSRPLAGTYIRQWRDINKSSYWKVSYPGSKCKRVR